jgi:hypothetical protein
MQAIPQPGAPPAPALGAPGAVTRPGPAPAGPLAGVQPRAAPPVMPVPGAGAPNPASDPATLLAMRRAMINRGAGGVAGAVLGNRTLLPPTPNG